MLDFPASPTVGQIFETWIWDGVKWAVTGSNEQLIDLGYINVLDFGADPTGAADSTAAINAAIASATAGGPGNGEIYIPGGNYLISNTITLNGNTVIRGAGRQLTTLTINSFNMSAQGVFVFGNDPGHPGTPTIKNLWIRFYQPNFAGMTRANLVQYPPAIYKAAATATGRPNLDNLMISGAWVGIFLDNCAAYVNNIYMSAFSYGFQWSWTTPTLDIVRMSNVHFWPFDISASSPLGVIFLDGTTNCAWFGRIDGLQLLNFFSESSIITVDCGPNPQGGYYFFQQIGLDGPANLVINSNVDLNMDSISNSRPATGSRFTAPSITINGGRNAIYNSTLVTSSTTLPMISVTNGVLIYYGGTTSFSIGDTPWAVCSGGTLEIHDTTFTTNNATPRTTPVISQTGTGYVQVVGCRFYNFPSNSVPSISITTSANAFIDANYYNVVQKFPTDYVTTSYGNRVIRADASVPTAAQLALQGIGAVNSLESKLRFHGTFGASVDYTHYLVAAFRAGWTTNSWTSGYLNLWLTNQGNPLPGSDANMGLAASFTLGGITVGNNTSTLNSSITFNGAAGTYRGWYAQTAGVARWGVSTGAVLETGSNVGTDFQINRFSDTGVNLGQPFIITRATGNAAFSGAVTIGQTMLIKGNVGFNNVGPVVQQTVTGAKGGNAALGSLIAALVNYGLIIDSTTA